MLYYIAGLYVKLDCHNITTHNAKKYLTYKNQEPNISIKINLDDVKEKIKKTKLNIDSGMYLIESQRFYRELLNYNGMMLHSSAVVVDNKAYLFSAPCGTGKSTHTGKWLELFGDRAYILNDDKPAIRIMDDGIYAYGTPWSGKHDISANKKVPLQGICFLERDTENWIKQMDAFTAVTRLYHGSLKRLTPEQIDKLTGIIDEIVKRIPIWTMGCLPDIEAAKTSFEAMSKAEVK